MKESLQEKAFAIMTTAILTLPMVPKVVNNLREDRAREEAKETCAVLGSQVERAIIATIYDSPDTRAGVAYYANMQRKLTEETCLDDHSVKANKR